MNKREALKQRRLLEKDIAALGNLASMTAPQVERPYEAGEFVRQTNAYGVMSGVATRYRDNMHLFVGENRDRRAFVFNAFMSFGNQLVVESVRDLPSGLTNYSYELSMRPKTDFRRFSVQEIDITARLKRGEGLFGLDLTYQPNAPSYERNNAEIVPGLVIDAATEMRNLLLRAHPELHEQGTVAG